MSILGYIMFFFCTACGIVEPRHRRSAFPRFRPLRYSSFSVFDSFHFLSWASSIIETKRIFVSVGLSLESDSCSSTVQRETWKLSRELTIPSSINEDVWWISCERHGQPFLNTSEVSVELRDRGRSPHRIFEINCTHYYISWFHQTFLYKTVGTEQLYAISNFYSDHVYFAIWL